MTYETLARRAGLEFCRLCTVCALHSVAVERFEAVTYTL
jgi:hypothetical protein